VELLNAALRRIVSDPAAVDALSQQAQAIGALSRVLDALLYEPKSTSTESQLIGTPAT
jgi:hypothetical protein